MNVTVASSPTNVRSKRLNIFERYLTVWVFLCMIFGVLIGHLLSGFTALLRDLQFAEGSQINIPIAILIWFMIYPMMLKIELGSLKQVGKRPKGLLITLLVNWMIKPFPWH
jgi:arsenite transporter